MGQERAEKNGPRGGDEASGDGAGVPPGGDGGRAPAEDALPKTVVRALQRLLAQRELTQQQFATDLGVTPTTVSRWLSRSQGVPFGTLRKICRVLGVRLEDLFVPQPGAPQQAGLTARPVPPWPEALAAEFARMDELRRDLDYLGRTIERLREASRAVPLFPLGVTGDPRRGEGDGGAAPAITFVQRPPGTARAVGVLGFAVMVDDDRLEGRGLHPGDIVFCNPSEFYGDGSLCVVGLDGAPGKGVLALRELAAGRGALDARTAPLSGPPRTTPAGEFFPYAPVTVLQAVWVLPEGRGHPDELHRLGRAPRPEPGGAPLDYSSDRTPNAGAGGPRDGRR